MNIPELIAAGYARTSWRHGLVSRLDREDWREHMASTHPRGMAWVLVLGEHAADLYRRCYSKDSLEVGSAIKEFPASIVGPTEYLPK